MKMPDFSKFPQSVWHSLTAVVAALLAAVLLILGVSALKYQPRKEDKAPTSSEASAGAIEAEKNKVESEGAK